MKLLSAAALILPLAAAAPLNSCSSQKECVDITVTKAANFCGEGSCNFRICLKLDYTSDKCTKNGSISHTCIRDSDQCVSDDGFIGSIETAGLTPADGYQCQTVKAGEEALFLLKDGNGCADSDTLLLPGGFQASCAPTEGDSKGPNAMSCTGNGIGKECTWVVQAPSTCSPGGGGGGDPHFKLWNRTRYDFHGEGDLVLLSNPAFDNDRGIDIHIRTTIKDFYSFIEATAIKIGQDVLEMSRGDSHSFKINGVDMNDSDLPMPFGGFLLDAPKKMGSGEAYRILLEDGDYIQLRTYKSLMSVDFAGSEEYFGESVGLLGNYHTSKLYGRDGLTIFNDNEAFGMEWQVRDTDEQLFSVAREPQWPQRVNMPTAASRNLVATPEQIARAQEVCSHKSKYDFEFCVTDVLATGDEGLAGAW